MIADSCGFCRDTGTYWIPGEQAISSIGRITFASTPAGWFACADCAALIKRKRWDLLIARIRDAIAEAMPLGISERLEARITDVAKAILKVFQMSRRGDPIRRVQPPGPLTPSGDLEAYITEWLRTWGGGPASFTADADRRATEMRDAFAGWGVDLTDKAIRRGLWALVAILHAQGDPLAVILSAALASAEAGVSLEDLPEL